MENLLKIASRVEAAVQAYVSVQGFSDKAEWKEKFMEEFKFATLEFKNLCLETKGPEPSLHPTLAALAIVLNRDEDLGRVTSSHPDLTEHLYYKEDAVFPSDLSRFLPESADRWWERLADAARREHAAQNPPPFEKKIKSVKLHVTMPPAQPTEESERSPMAVDNVPEEPRNRGRPKAAVGAAATRKRKGSAAAAGGAAKRQAKSTQRPEPAEQGSDPSDPEPAEEEDLERYECARCIKAEKVCQASSTGPCKQCQSNKQKCSLMPLNPKTGKTDRRVLTKAEVRNFRRQQTEIARKAFKKGKGRALDSPDAGEPDVSGLVPSPLEPLASLGNLTLDSGGSSAANTPADSPNTLPQLPLPEHPAPTPPLSIKAGDASKSSAGVAAEVPSTSKLLTPPPRQSSRSHSDVSPVSDDRSNAARIAVLEKRQGELEKRVQDLDRRLTELGR